ncbi:MAG: NAD-dependent epimerase/dehydratase family protein, partial [Candidatus Dadabacteria bacterium]
MHTVTGAFGYSGKYIAKALLERGKRVRTLTNSLERESELKGKVEVFPLNFDRPKELLQALEGTEVLYNTYWIRFNTKFFTIKEALKNTLILFLCAKEAGVKRIVHISITNPSLDSPYEYFRGKAKVERALKESGISFSILRPAVLFGEEDILINNIAWG